MSKTVVLKQGLTYGYERTKYSKGVPVQVDVKTGDYLLGTGRFEEVQATKTKETPQEKTKKVRIKKPDTSKVKAQEDEEAIPIFKSKKELAEFAKKEHGLVFEGEIKRLKMGKMRGQLEAHIKSENTPESKEVTMEV